MTDNHLTNDLANAAERLLQFVDSSKTGNPGEARYAMRKLREAIAAVRERQNEVSDAD